MLVGENARLSGLLKSVSGSAVTLSVPWQSADVTVARPGVQAVFQRPGEARVFAETFRRINPMRWSVTGTTQVLAESVAGSPHSGLKIPPGGVSLLRKLDEPLISGRLDVSFRDDGKVVAGEDWILSATFRGPSGPASLRVILGWKEESLAVESPDGPSLAVQRLARTPGWHRLTLRFAPEQIEIAVDGKELAHGKGPAGPLDQIKLATSSHGSTSPPKDLAAYVREIQLIRFAEPPASLEIDPTQDEARLVVGDQLYGVIRRADAEHVGIDVLDQTVTLDWGDVAGLCFRRIPTPGVPIEGLLARVHFRATAGEPARDLDFAEGALVEVSELTLTVATSYAGTLRIPRDHLSKLRVLDRGWRLVIDPAAHHLGDNIRTSPPFLDPPLPEGGVLERTFDGGSIGRSQAFLVLDVIDVVGETAGSPYSNLIAKGELRTYVAINGKRVDYINRYITTANETPERIKIPIPSDLLKPGANLLRIEQTGIANDPTWFDDLGILQIALQTAPAEISPPGQP